MPCALYFFLPDIDAQRDLISFLIGNSYDHYSETKFREVPMQKQKARGVAIRKKAFGEGSERFAFQFFEIESDGATVVGDALVAKTTRFVDQDKNFAKRFSMLQYHAQLLAQ